MEHIAFRMQLKPGPAIAAEYQRRHDAIWPELASLLHDSGVRDYSIFLDAGTGALFAVLRRIDGHAMDALPQHPVMRRWWDYMADLMDTRPDASPVAVPLVRVFHLA
ncbi:L-rhamnose mutarotase [Janthinobacterium sp. GW460P]|uniref:L-rhamnose mutarotase n=1 Tax=unclassified Janthinobacterium TaxID=2610881 RepID=UPI000A329971|nr:MULTISPECIES: L-rhamnose mutarotase [unclassified Janthinobacterium]MCC7703563.1 L-rhamnose mutarotase [Janthinobacterium sp. GW460P]MCC7709070.1 L-rhamnose mutarotase [Janthinobacterium sp. GW460W]